MAQHIVRVYGSLWCGDCRLAKRVLDEHQVPYEWIDTDSNSEARAYVRKVNGGYQSIPTIVFPDGSILVEPSYGELAQKLATQSLTDRSSAPAEVNLPAHGRR